MRSVIEPTECTIQSTWERSGYDSVCKQSACTAVIFEYFTKSGGKVAFLVIACTRHDGFKPASFLVICEPINPVEPAIKIFLAIK